MQRCSAAADNHKVYMMDIGDSSNLIVISLSIYFLTIIGLGLLYTHPPKPMRDVDGLLD